MPRPGFLTAQLIVTERISGVVGTIAQTPSNATIGIYDGTINSSVFGSIIGGFYFQTRQLTVLDSVSVTNLITPLTGSILSIQVYNFGKQMGTLYGTIIGTVISDTNYVLCKAYVIGTLAAGVQMPPKELLAGAPVLGTISLLVTGR
jgi:hypothetical protein